MTLDITPIIDGLNEAQREAVTATEKNLVVLAGAGSGKTRVLVHRMAYVMRVYGRSPFELLAVTFTNKAAKEMQLRVQSLLEQGAHGLWVGTFHGIAHRLLRAHWKEADLPQQFQIIDTDDQLRIVKRIMKNEGIDDGRFPPKQALGYINNRKEEGVRAGEIEPSFNPIERIYHQVYVQYEQTCLRSGLVDFAELLLKTLELLRDNTEIKAHYHQRFRHVLVDEFQDTNSLQYAILQHLIGRDSFVFAVGDDDQSIYGWRGAKIENIQNLEKDYANTQVIRLEQNYRSTSTILAAANTLIANNTGRMGKNLWTDGEAGEPIQFYQAFNDYDEMHYVVDQIENWVGTGLNRSDIAILYRSNAQSRMLEEGLIAAQIPYRVYGGLRFFERAEIKDALAYMRLVRNRSDDAAFERIVNMPPRGLGDKTLDKLRESARFENRSLWDAGMLLLEQKGLTGRAHNALSHFFELMFNLSQLDDSLALHEQVEHTVEGSTLKMHYGKEKSESARSRVENLEELINATRRFEIEQTDEIVEGMTMMDAFIANAVLESGEGQADAWEDCVQMMSLHSAKGLEFPAVAIVGLEEGLFPHQRSIEDGDIEEERRLAYVGMTRARQYLLLTATEQRRLYGKEVYPRLSRFIGEIPQELINEVRMTSRGGGLRGSSTANSEDNAYGNLKTGASVFHQKFGEGVILALEGEGDSARIHVNFNHAGDKWLVLAYANLELIP